MCVCVLLSHRELFSPAQKYQLLVYHADAIFHDKEYRNAACKYNMALQQKKVLSKTSKVRPSSTGGPSSVQTQVRYSLLIMIGVYSSYNTLKSALGIYPHSPDHTKVAVKQLLKNVCSHSESC